jgi:hypothetical protein
MSFCNFASGCREKQKTKNKIVAAARPRASLTMSFRNFASGCREKQKTKNKVVAATRPRASLTISFCNFASGCKGGAKNQKQNCSSNAPARFPYHFVLQFRFWLQREAKSQKQNRSSSALSAQTFPVRLKNQRLRRYFGHSQSKQDAGAAQQRARPPLPSLVDQKKFGACGALPLPFHFAISLLTAGRSKQSKANSEKSACA